MILAYYYLTIFILTQKLHVSVSGHSSLFYGKKKVVSGHIVSLLIGVVIISIGVRLYR